MAEPDLKALFRSAIEELAGPDGEMGEMRDSLAGMTELARAHAAPGFACVMRGLPPTPPATFPGVEGIAAAWRDYMEAFASVRTRLVSVHESATHLVVVVDQRAKTRHGGVAISQPSAMVIGVSGERLTGIAFHLDIAEALRVGGIGR